jgi:creatinine amidohydrolase
VDLLPVATSADERLRGAKVAVLPVGAFEQHGEFHPLITDTVVACAIAKRLCEDYGLLLLPPVTISCSQEHASFAGSVSIRASTLTAVVNDIADSLRDSGISHLAIVNGHGGNYVLKNVVQEANVVAPRMTLFPMTEDWNTARREAGMTTTTHDDMHAGELETSLLLHVAPELLRPGFDTADTQAESRPHLLVVGMAGYTENGVIGTPSLGTQQKGAKALDSLATSFRAHLAAAKQALPSAD